MSNNSNSDQTPDVPRRTQWDGQLLQDGVQPNAIYSNNGRQMLILDQGGTVTVLAFGGEKPFVRAWLNRELLWEIPLELQPHSPCIVATRDGWQVWFSCEDESIRVVESDGAVETLPYPRERLHDAACEGTRVLLLLSRDEKLSLAVVEADDVTHFEIDRATERATFERDADGSLHLVYEKRQGLEYRRYDSENFSAPAFASRAAEAFCSHPALLCVNGTVLIAYRGEQCRRPSYKHWSDAWERLGRGGYIGALVLDGGQQTWRRFRLADSRQIAMRLRMPPYGPYGAGDGDIMRLRLEEFSPPALCLADDGVPQVLWADVERRWICQSRFLGESFSDPIEIRGPLEQLTGVLAPRRTQGQCPLVMLTQTRAHLDELVLPGRAVSNGRQIDWTQTDELSRWRGLELVINQMQRHAENPVIPCGESGSVDDGGVVADIFHESGEWHAEYSYFSHKGEVKGHPGWTYDGRAKSNDGVHWEKLAPIPLEKKYCIADDDGEDVESLYTIRSLRDVDEPNPQHRFKGFYRSAEHEPWGWLAITSADGVKWRRVPSSTVVRADDDLRVWRDEHDIPARRFKASAISRSHCGRICAQWTSEDGMHWNDERETLNFFEPWTADPDHGSTGRILLDAWAGPDDEDEVHGGYVFRDGQRQLLHYMKWTADGHVYLGLAASRDGMNFSRVGGGQSTLPLGEAGSWEAGRIAIREAPFLVGDPGEPVWRQFYTGCGWKHGFAGTGAKTSHVGTAAPNQMGIAEIPAGHWTHLQMRRECETGELESVAYLLEHPHRLELDIAGLGEAGSEIACCILDPSGNAMNGFGYEDCDLIEQNSRRVVVTWRGQGLQALGMPELKIGVRFKGMRLQLFGIHLTPLSA